ncbi:phage minor head protein [Amycolatopsis benzoatilytica]|uniref:phage minor head protein n=1 Tax=Amycolatopsis benzoatilytica TaxID=346045 RepID=UPI00037C91CF|nr:phage minor head protein [Amycolatopsis benzoatilytica]
MGKRRKQGRRPPQTVRRGGLGIPDAAKANIPTAAQGARDASTAVASMTQRGRGQIQPGYEQQALPRPDIWYQNPFGPGLPSIPVGIDAPRPDTGRPEPRIFEYSVGWNLPGKHNRLLPWKLLRDAADFIPLFRRCIGIRQDRIGALDWGVRLTKTAIQNAERDNPGTPRVELERKLRDENAAAIERCEAFWQMPDRRNRRGWNAWLRILLEEVFVGDALSIYPVYTYGGDLHSLEILDGTTIKPLLDERGGRPQPPFPAFQQILWGYPRRDLSMEVDADGGTGPLMPSDQLIYEPRNQRVWTPYGHSAVEQALSDGELYMHRHRWMTLEYTAGSMPTSLFEVAADAGLSPQQVAELERYFNDLHAGDSAQRQHVNFLPPGIVPSREGGGVAERYKPDYDLHLIKLVASHFDTTLPELGFTETNGLGSSGFHEGQENVQDRKDQSLIKWLKRLLTDVTRTQLGAPDELEFYFLGLDDEDEAAADDVEQGRLNGGVITLNERRDRLGLPRYEFDEADMPALFTQRGLVFLEGASSLEPAGTFITPPQAPPGSPNPNTAAIQADETGAAGDQDGDANPAEPEPAQQKPPTNAAGTEAAKKAELAAYRKFAAKGTRAREFRWQHHTPAEVDAIKAGGVDPKGPVAKEWPGWKVDQAAAKLWGKRISAALTRAVDAQTIAADWRHARKAAPIYPGQVDAQSWLAQNGVTVTATLRGVLRDVYTDGYLIGDRSAAALLANVEPDWGSWTPGDTEAALDLLAGDTSLQALLEQADVTITSIAAHRMDALALELARAVENGDSADTLAANLARVLDDPRWARMVATTELNRAMSSATLNRYARNGIEAAYWMTAEDERVCPDCTGNEDAGAIPLSQPFPSGSYQPPAHPDCRCALAPMVVDISEVDTAGLSAADLEES